jgi:hypothetical protein
VGGTVVATFLPATQAASYGAGSRRNVRQLRSVIRAIRPPCRWKKVLPVRAIS